MSTTMTNRLEFTATGYIYGMEDVYNDLVCCFTEASKKGSQLARKNPIRHYRFFCCLTSETPVKRPDEIFTTLEGITK